MKKIKVEYFVVLKCNLCGSTHDYEGDLFRKSHLKRYIKDGYVSQHCGCLKSDGLDNSKHHIVGIVEIRTRKMKASTVVKNLGLKKYG